jgi:hypothetical protein
MKNLTVLILVFATTFSASAMRNRPGRKLEHNCIYVLSMDADLFYFKSDRDVDGAAINVYDFKTGNVVISDTIHSKKTIIDLYFQKPGDYIIMITKGDFTRRYVFERR